MDVKLDSLIEKLRKEGVEEAQQASEEMIAKAREDSASIVEDARKEAEKILEDAQREVAQLQETGELALQQAARDAELLLKSRITELFDRVFRKEISESLTPDSMREIILSLVDQWGKGMGAEIVLNEDQSKKVEDLLFSGLKKELKDSITIRTSGDITSGFRIGLEKDSVYYDFTDESISEVLMAFIQPRLKAILDGENG